MRFLSIGLFYAIFAVPAGAAPATSNRVLPASVGAWSSSQTQLVRPESLETFSPGDAPILREYGLLDAERTIYENAGRQLIVTLYRMRDASAAYGAYTFLRSADMAASDLAEKSAVGRDRVLVVERNLLLDVAGTGTASLADLKALVAKITPFAEMTPYPTIWEYLPTQGFVPNSDHYVLGPKALEHLFPRTKIRPNSGQDNSLTHQSVSASDWVGFSDGAEAELAGYRLHGEAVALLLVRYPTRQITTKHLEALGKLFVVNPPGDVAAVPHDALPALFVVRKSALLAIVVGTQSPAVASALIRGVQYETQLTWSEPSWKATEKPFVELLYGVFVGTGVLLIYGVVASLAFGLVRLTVKRMLPNRVFDRPNQMEVLQLGIYSKPIEAKDFYSGEPPA